MKITHFSATDTQGGAERLAYELHKGIQERGAESHLFVGLRTIEAENITELYRANPLISSITRPFTRFCRKNDMFKVAKLGYWLEKATPYEVYRQTKLRQGYEDFFHPRTSKYFDKIPQDCDVVHCHNLHGGYFDLRQLPALTKKFPTVCSLQDAWFFTGHCAHWFDCEKWQTSAKIKDHGCQKCPNLETYPAIPVDNTSVNWQIKRKILEQSEFHIIAVCHWLKDNLSKSIVKPVGVKVIHNGIDENYFVPASKKKTRGELNLPQDEFILLAVGQDLKNNSFKNYELMREAMEIIGTKTNKKITLICRGSKGKTLRYQNAKINFTPFTAKAEGREKYYQAADVFIHPAKADTLPTVVSEALACELPVIATDVCGIPEQVEDGKNGFLVKNDDAEELAQRIIQLAENTNTLQKLRANTRQTVLEKFTVKQNHQKHLEYYAEISERAKAKNQQN